MRIAYLVHFRGGAETGIHRKVREHVTEWSRQGVEVGLFVATDRAGRDDWAAIPCAASVHVMARGLRSLLSARERLVRDVDRWKPDAIYARQTMAYPGLIGLVRRRPTVFEVNANDLAEFRLQSPRRYWYARLTRGLLLGHSAGLVFVTRELASEPSMARYGRPSVVIANGIRLTDIPELPAPVNTAPRLLFVGHPDTPWHGLDRIEAIAQAFPSWRFDIVGPRRDEFSPAVPSNVVTHGLSRPDEYAPLLASADVAIGTLGLYRKGMAEASPLKVREYLGAGIPVITGCRDTDFPDGAPFLLPVPNAPGVDRATVAAIAQFVARWRGQRVPRAAVAHLDSGAKETERLAFLEHLEGPTRRAENPL